METQKERKEKQNATNTYYRYSNDDSMDSHSNNSWRNGTDTHYRYSDVDNEDSHRNSQHTESGKDVNPYGF
jgi:hypothetical protein